MSAETGLNSYRRKFLKGVAGVAAAVTIAPGVVLRQVNAKPASEAVTNEKRWGMLIINSRLKDGGQGVVDACKKEHGWGDEEYSSTPQQTQWVRKVKVTDKQTKHSFTLPVMCQHCETAPCADVCPTGASFKRADGIVLVDKHICIGCRYCMMACPYKARSLVHEPLSFQKADSPRGMGTVESCTMCVHRIDNDQLPACAEAEPEAIIFGDLNNPESDISRALKEYGGKQIRADLGLNTGVRYNGI